MPVVDLAWIPMLAFGLNISAGYPKTRLRRLLSSQEM